MQYQIAEAQAAFDEAASAYGRRDYAAVRKACAKVLALKVPAYERSYARLRAAQSYLAEGNTASARAEYQALSADKAAPTVHREEAASRMSEIDRVARGEPASRNDAVTSVVPVANWATTTYCAPAEPAAGKFRAPAICVPE